MNSRKRGEATKAILQRLKKGPAFPKQLSEELKLPESTVKHNLRKILLNQGSIKQLNDGKYALDSWNPDDLKIKNSYEHLRKLLFRQPTPEEISALIQDTPSNSRDMLFKYIPGYYEPSEYEKEFSSRRILYTICLGLELEPTIEEIDARNYGRMGIIIRGLKIPPWKMQEWMEQNNIIFSKEISREYLKEFPEMDPKFQRYFKGNDLYVILEWSDYAIHLLHSVPEFGGSLNLVSTGSPIDEDEDEYDSGESKNYVGLWDDEMKTSMNRY